MEGFRGQCTSLKERDKLASIFPRMGEKANDRPRYSWQSVMDHFRPQIENKWKRFSEKERNNWNRLYANIWGRFRNRAPERVHKELNALVGQGKITPRKEKVNNIRRENDTVYVETDRNTIAGDEVING